MYKKVEPYINFYNSNKYENYWLNNFQDQKIFGIILSNQINSKDKTIILRENEVALYFNVHKEMCDKNDCLNTGAIMSFIDACTSYIIISMDKNNRLSVSIELSFKKFAEVKVNEKIILICNLDSLKENLAYLSIKVLNEELNEVFTATHTKFLFDGTTFNLPLAKF